MKKLKLKALELGAKEILTRDQLKGIMGGSGTCGNVYTFESGSRCVGATGLSKSEAMQNSYDFNTGSAPDEDLSFPDWGTTTDLNWCCDSCGSVEPCSLA